ncbi:LacI family DNA-binding transcriptional regulator [Clostridium botulinum]|uniref:LacI family DNA-binding transcriptional regulator n=1 Tax=Clostridium botulinum TaxID=1491 RepID=UPI00144C82D7|nr:LacI family DNA-binding transcriptional regulator [Clostridium botulinum]NFG24703.1 LacI family transcriptional regulator [Clostridium botulinum]NFO03623.1 LacI family transcriptional regulator [Clostridium botulinum]UZP02873.1 LacI family DNA-binding transcriptional regulator [Clostridium botulinum]UZP06231.1 LacI family DNA-binding transcriptional regulator [Clostridium botulinum]UZP09612.1 LacI family DNA-binding transcriptional regulator [Clostridium botulinum]
MGATINDIAKIADVSSTTVSRVLNNSGYVKEETRQKVLNVIKEMNYTPSAIARSLSKSETNTIGIIVPDITNNYFGEIIKGISEIAEEKNLNIVLFNTDNSLEKELKALKSAKAQRIKGIIMTPAFGDGNFKNKYTTLIEQLNIPVVLVSADIKHSNLSGVFVDNLKCGLDATRLLISEGHKKIGIITGNINSDATMDMLSGYKKALIESDINIIDEYIFNADFKAEIAYKLTNNIFKMKDKPTALVICSNMMTMGAIRALIDSKKKTPEDISIVGINRVDFLDIVGLQVTYVEDSPIKLGKSSMDMLWEIINNKNDKSIRRTIMAPRIICNGSEKKMY